MRIDFSVMRDSRIAKWRKSFEWHRWFAWHPVRVKDARYAWLEVVLRKRYTSWYGFQWRYRGRA